MPGRPSAIRGLTVMNFNRRVSQMQALLAACREPVENFNRLSYVLYAFERIY